MLTDASWIYPSRSYLRKPLCLTVGAVYEVTHSIHSGAVPRSGPLNPAPLVTKAGEMHFRKTESRRYEHESPLFAPDLSKDALTRQLRSIPMFQGGRYTRDVCSFRCRFSTAAKDVGNDHVPQTHHVGVGARCPIVQSGSQYWVRSEPAWRASKETHESYPGV